VAERLALRQAQSQPVLATLRGARLPG